MASLSFFWGIEEKIKKKEISHNRKCKILNIDTTRKNVNRAQGLNTHKMFPSQQPIGIFRRLQASLAPTQLVGQLVQKL